MLSARACNAQHASEAARRAGMRRSVERELTLLVPIRVASARAAEAVQKPNAGPAMSRGRRRFQAHHSRHHPLAGLVLRLGTAMPPRLRGAKRPADVIGAA